MKKISRRSKVKHPGLNKTYTLPIRQELVDYDYIHKLSPEEKEWLNKFNEEEINGNIYGKGKKINKKKADRKKITDRINARNRDSYSRAKVRGTLDMDVDTGNMSYTNEDDLIEKIDAEREMNIIIRRVLK